MIRIQCPNCRVIHEVQAIPPRKIPVCACGHRIPLSQSILPEPIEQRKPVVNPEYDWQPPGRPQPQHSYCDGVGVGSRRATAILLSFFLGGFGAHKFYLGFTNAGVGYLILFWTGIPALLAFLEFISYVFATDGEFNRQYDAEHPAYNPQPHSVIKSVVNIVAALGIVLVVGYILIRVVVVPRPVIQAGLIGSVGGDFEAQIKTKAAQDFERQYRIAKRQGDQAQICSQAMIVSSAYLMAQDEAAYQHWMAVQKMECGLAGL